VTLRAPYVLKYAQVIKMRVNGRLKKVVKRIIFGKDIDHKMIYQLHWTAKPDMQTR